MAFRPDPVRPDERDELAPTAGLCARCRHLQVLRSKRSIFVRCARADDDPRFARYPRLPMQVCPGFEPATDGERGS